MCPSCQSHRKIMVEFLVDSHTLYECTDCGFDYRINDEPSQERIDNYFEAVKILKRGKDNG